MFFLRLKDINQVIYLLLVLSYESVCDMFPHIPSLRCITRLNKVQSTQPKPDILEKTERGSIALLYLHSKFKSRLKDGQLFLTQNCLRNTPFLLSLYSIRDFFFFLSFVAVTLLSLQLNSSQCMLPVHPLAEVQQTQAN